MRTHCNGLKISGEATVQYFIEAAVITGYVGGKDVFITQTPQTPPEYSFTIARIQLPIRMPSLKFVRHHPKIPRFLHKTVVCLLLEKRGGKNKMLILASKKKKKKKDTVHKKTLQALKCKFLITENSNIDLS